MGLRDEFYLKLTLNTSQFNSSAKQATNSVNILTKGMKTLIYTVRDIFYFGIAVKYVKQLTSAYFEQEYAIARLTKLMRNVPGVTKDATQSVIDLTIQMSKFSTVAKDTLQVGASQLSTFFVQAESIKALLPGFQDTLIGLYGFNTGQKEAVTIANLLGKALMGLPGTLRRWGIVVSQTQADIMKTGTEMERVAVLSEVLKMNFGGLAEEMAKTMTGRLEIVKRDFREVSKLLGAYMIPLLEVAADALRAFALGLAEIMSDPTTMFKKIYDGIKIVFDGTSIAGKALMVFLGTFGLFKTAALVVTGFTKVIEGLFVTTATFATKVNAILLLAISGFILFTTAWDNNWNNVRVNTETAVKDIADSLSKFREGITGIFEVLSGVPEFSFTGLEESLTKAISGAYDTVKNILTLPGKIIFGVETDAMWQDNLVNMLTVAGITKAAGGSWKLAVSLALLSDAFFGDGVTGNSIVDSIVKLGQGFAGGTFLTKSVTGGLAVAAAVALVGVVADEKLSTADKVLQLIAGAIGATAGFIIGGVPGAMIGFTAAITISKLTSAEDIEKQADNIWKKITDSFNNTVNSGQLMLLNIQTNWNDLVTAGKNIWNGLVEGITPVIDFAKLIGDKIAESWDGITSVGKQIGDAIVAGIKSVLATLDVFNILGLKEQGGSSGAGTGRSFNYSGTGSGKNYGTGAGGNPQMMTLFQEMDVLKKAKGDVPKFATGNTAYLNRNGVIKGNGTDTSDNILAWLSPGEAVINAKSTRKYRDILTKINENKFANGNIPKFAQGNLESTVINNPTDISSLLSQVLDTVAKLYSAMSEGFMDTLNAAGIDVKAYGEEVKGLIDSLDKYNENINAYNAEWESDPFNDVEQALKSFRESIWTTVKTNIEATKGGDILITGFRKQIRDLIESITDNQIASERDTQRQTASDKFMQPILGQLEQGLSAVKGAFTQYVDMFAEPLTSAFVSIGESLGGSATFLGSIFTGLGGITASISSAFLELLSPALMLAPILGGISQVISPLLNDILMPLTDVLVSFGQVIGVFLLPLIMAFKVALSPVIMVINAVTWAFDQIILWVNSLPFVGGFLSEEERLKKARTIEERTTEYINPARTDISGTGQSFSAGSTRQTTNNITMIFKENIMLTDDKKAQQKFATLVVVSMREFVDPQFAV